MSMLLLQTFLLMLTAFFLGAVVACLIKSTFFDVAEERTAEPIPVPAPVAAQRPAAVLPQPLPRPAPDAVRPKIETVARPTAPSMPLPDAQRFERALREQTAIPAQPQPVSAPPPPVVPPAAPAAAVSKPAMPVAQVAPKVEVKPPAPIESKKPDVATPPPVAPRVDKPAAPAARPDAGMAAAAAAAAALATVQARAAAASPSPAPVPPPPAAPAAPAAPAPVAAQSAPAPPAAPRPIMPVAAGSAGPAAVSAPVQQPAAAPVAMQADDLTRIRAIDASTQSRLNALGVRRFDEIARWTTADVARFRADSAIGSRIARENWIEQAQILAKGGTSDYARRRAAQDRPMVTAAPSPNAGVAAPLRAPQAPTSAPAAATAAAPAPPAASPPAAASMPAAEPAAPAATAVPSAPAAAAPKAGFELPRSGAQAAAAAAAAIAAAAAASARRTASVASAPATADTAAVPAAAAGRDDLQRIHGVNAEIEKLLNGQGFTRYAQIAALSAADTDRLNGLLGTPGRISRENWIEQAAVLASGAAGTYTRRADLSPKSPDTDTSRPARLSDALREREAATKTPEPVRPAAPPAGRPDLSNLRSVRSEALRGDVAGGGAADDLKRIRGIGVLIEKKLNSLGVSTYEQVANWTGADIDRISQILDFKGRIEREGWVEQARILASGGKTEFSQRVDKGDA